MILPSGRAAVVTVSSDSRVGDVKVLAQQQLRQGAMGFTMYQVGMINKDLSTEKSNLGCLGLYKG